MKLQTLKLDTTNLNNQIISQDIIDSFKDGNQFYVIPTSYWEDIIQLLKTYKVFNNDDSILKLLQLLTYLINSDKHSSDILNTIAPGNYKKYIELLGTCGILINFDKYITGVRPKSYNLRKDNNSVTIIFNDITSEDLIIEDEFYLEEGYLSKTEYKMKGIKKETLLNTNINIPMAIYQNHKALLKEESNSPIDNYAVSFSMRMSGIFRFINNPRKAFISDKCGRCYTSFTELTKESRKCVYITIGIQDYYFHELDMANCVPTLLANSLMVQGISSGMLRDTGSGVFYKKLKERIIQNGGENWFYYKDKEYLSFKENKHIKKMVCSTILYGNLSNPYLTNTFNELYPEEALHINHMKYEMDSKEFANSNMRIEADIFLNLGIETHNFTCHDAIYYIGLDNTDEIKRLVKDKMVDKFGIETSFLLKGEENDNDDIDIEIDTVNNSTVFIFEEKKSKKQIVRDNNINKIKIAIESGCETNKELVENTGLSLATVKRLKNQ